ncbi:MAG: hypothetical protein H0V82_05305 [Candidatus Protochlamydia sp.]|nr:hypothetical protein [Candidatus Protochlamydia sp.]
MAGLLFGILSGVGCLGLEIEGLLLGGLSGLPRLGLSSEELIPVELVIEGCTFL